MQVSKCISSDAHFCWSPVIDQLKSQKTDCSNSRKDFGLIEITVLVVSHPIVFTMWQTGLLFSHRIQASCQNETQTS